MTFGTFTITKRNDGSSPILFKNCCSGLAYATAHIAVMKAGGAAPVKYLEYEFELVAVSNIRYSVPQDSVMPLEKVSFECGTLILTYTPQRPTARLAPRSWAGGIA
ncbi:MAG TPA: type VI secretion system tube protein Hcp [Gemmatimonadaceae bacterium]|nr:type VI secretion system tube protein Hcp [Gemmatimonadaceae bacterium]